MGTWSNDGNLRGWKNFRSAPESGRNPGAGDFQRISLEESSALFDRASRRRIRRSSTSVQKLSARISPGGPASGENGGNFHHIPRMSQLAASGISGPGDRHGIAAAVHFRYHG